MDTIQMYTCLWVNNLVSKSWRTDQATVVGLMMTNFMVLAENHLNPHRLQNGIEVSDHRAMGDITCECTKVPPELAFVPKVQSKTQ